MLPSKPIVIIVFHCTSTAHLTPKAKFLTVMLLVLRMSLGGNRVAYLLMDLSNVFLHNFINALFIILYNKGTEINSQTMKVFLSARVQTCSCEIL